jgi:Mrp family chromosome partitioning ATPase
VPPENVSQMSGSATDLTDHVASLTASRVVIVAGKGGVGKTTVTAVLACAAARRGLRVLAVELDGKPALADLVAERRAIGGARVDLCPRRARRVPA